MRGGAIRLLSAGATISEDFTFYNGRRARFEKCRFSEKEFWDGRRVHRTFRRHRTTFFIGGRKHRCFAWQACTFLCVYCAYTMTFRGKRTTFAVSAYEETRVPISASDSNQIFQCACHGKYLSTFCFCWHAHIFGLWPRTFRNNRTTFCIGGP